jgi:hypothetical protein
MDKVVVKEIKERKRKRKYKQTGRVVESGIVVDKITIRIVEKHAKAQFTIACTPITIKEVGDKFH